MFKVEAHGAAIPAIGLGTWPLTGAECERAVIEALGAGYRHIDTAAMYGNEAAVGAALRASSVRRDEVFLVTKVLPENIGPGDLQRSAEASLRRLGVDAVDLLLIHWPNPRIPLRASMAALADAKRRGLARHIGVSNYPARLLAEAWSLTEEPIVADQCEYHPAIDQGGTIAECRRRGTAFVSYSPLEKRAALRHPTVAAMAARLGRTPAQVVLRWHLQQGCVAIPKSGNPRRIRENLAVFDFALAAADMAALSALRRR